MFHFLRNLFSRNPLGLALWRILQFPYPYRIALVELVLLLLPRVRPHYYSGLFEAAQLARRLRIGRISAIEFGVAGGGGLIAMERYAARVARVTGIEIDVYGFDMISGLPKATDVRDMPYAWEEGAFKADTGNLSRRLRGAKVIEGDIAETLPKFLESEKPSPVGFISVDVDYYTSTMAVLQLFDGRAERYLPRVVCYFDDLGNGSLFTGEHAAIETFNADTPSRKIARHDSFYTEFIYSRRAALFFVMHDFKHPRYAEYTGFAAHTVDQTVIRG